MAQQQCEREAVSSVPFCALRLGKKTRRMLGVLFVFTADNRADLHFISLINYCFAPLKGVYDDLNS